MIYDGSLVQPGGPFILFDTPIQARHFGLVNANYVDGHARPVRARPLTDAQGNQLSGRTLDNRHTMCWRGLWQMEVRTTAGCAFAVCPTKTRTATGGCWTSEHRSIGRPLRIVKELERETGFEPATLGMGGRCSTPELLPHALYYTR
jgi:hypothetical protein